MNFNSYGRHVLANTPLNHRARISTVSMSALLFIPAGSNYMKDMDTWVADEDLGLSVLMHIIGPMQGQTISWEIITCPFLTS